MQTQRDHVHAHQFMVGRLSSALIEGDATRAEIPGRRALTGLWSGLLVAVLVLAGFAVYGWIVPGGSRAFAQRGVILVEKETGVRYVYLSGLLHPTPNLTSALLIQGTGATVKPISRASLKGVPRGVELGIAGAPQSVQTDRLSAGPWLVCLPGAVADNPGEALGINLDPRAPAVPLAADRFTVVRGPAGEDHVLATGRRFRVDSPAVLVALGVDTARPIAAPRRWLDLLPEGPPLAPADIPRAGSGGPSVAGRSYPVGTLFRRGDEQFFVLRADGLAPMSPTEFLFASAVAAGQPVDLDLSALVSAPRSADRSLTERLPELAALRWQPAGELVPCLRQGPRSARELSGAVAFTPRELSGVDGAGKASVLAAPGTAMVVVPVPHEGAGAPVISYVSDAGVAYTVADGGSAAALKLDGVAPVPFPKSLLATLPAGAVLSRGAALAPQRG
ncbi:type VII secretion protein EccB [Virgisporangium aliadipatigenens]|uniref:Type VII secretion protein EccB n=1 Tax=Virgisporangium aliadipatigenens TaxID=741659 RepID=A0A8J3YRH4_9ACTN|nr:type VII secretion protein EccB [Virgisporangium aliadipatigenens]GIJ50339.1 type VII secretion protein EccB [Virgisporangium aliadipatigenens]